MRHVHLFTEQHVALLADWLKEIGALAVHIYLPHTGGSGESFSIATLAELRQLVAQQTHPEILILVFRQAEVTQADLDRADDLAWVYRHSDQILYFAVTKNLSLYPPYAADQEKYEAAIREWSTQKI